MHLIKATAIAISFLHAVDAVALKGHSIEAKKSKVNIKLTDCHDQIKEERVEVGECKSVLYSDITRADPDPGTECKLYRSNNDCTGKSIRVEPDMEDFNKPIDVSSIKCKMTKAPKLKYGKCYKFNVELAYGGHLQLVHRENDAYYGFGGPVEYPIKVCSTKDCSDKGNQDVDLDGGNLFYLYDLVGTHFSNGAGLLGTWDGGGGPLAPLSQDLVNAGRATRFWGYYSKCSSDSCHITIKPEKFSNWIGLWLPDNNRIGYCGSEDHWVTLGYEEIGCDEGLPWSSEKSIVKAEPSSPCKLPPPLVQNA
ncbi:hypothetical protein BDV25DRAFT_139579 [Aspergillus avenaceus]|uniref:Uncharacterized protein n=1 Tax=Aspergillus avenaceus TaxID=36643 RepID=A0A5N6TWJ4_ASPAV|nr:hypothetical protein BDV25DRAFT_139579 [Aspergillus avenaceus]